MAAKTEHDGLLLLKANERLHGESHTLGLDEGRD